MNKDMMSHLGMELKIVGPLRHQPAPAEGRLHARARLHAGGAHRDPRVRPAGSGLRLAQGPGHSSEEPRNQTGEVAI